MAETPARHVLLLSAVDAPHYYHNQIQAFADFEASIAFLSSVDVAKAITVRMCRIYLQHSYTPQGVDKARTELPGLVQTLGNAEVSRLYEEFVNVWNGLETRLTHQLPLLDAKGQSKGGEVPEGAPKGLSGEQSRRSEDSEAERHQYPQEKQINMPVTSIKTVEAPTSPQSTTSIMASKGSSTPPTHDDQPLTGHTLIPITNPEAFPVSIIQEAQAGYYPSLGILSMWLHLDTANQPILVTADIENGPIDHLLIRNPRTIAFLGLSSSPPSNTIVLQPTERIDETYTIRLVPGHEDPRDPDAWVVGELLSARHAYLYWLDERNSADPKGPPMAAEARAIARRTRRKALDVMREIERYWEMEYGSGGQRFRERRAVLLGEDPVFEGSRDGRMKRCMWI
ncbi:uncharacterized protein yc1106_08927 [Curvularia clavata]|uniref:Uncharacterized protein n=1 Tax=Curvularia clavata TaxID=95742 RepID=A0A9Q9DV12_CURCL|nr:uncharacterized protein yc1106_08927 [Curvularia clavata]